MNLNKILKITFLIVFTVYFTGCAGKPISFTSVNPEEYKDNSSQGRSISAEASGFQLLLFIPIGVNDRHQQAYDVLKGQANGDIITDIKITESWTYALVGTVYTTRLTAMAYPRDKK